MNKKFFWRNTGLAALPILTSVTQDCASVAPSIQTRPRFENHKIVQVQYPPYSPDPALLNRGLCKCSNPTLTRLSSEKHIILQVQHPSYTPDLALQNTRLCKCSTPYNPKTLFWEIQCCASTAHPIILTRHSFVKHRIVQVQHITYSPDIALWNIGLCHAHHTHQT